MRRISSYQYFGCLESCSSKSHAQRILILGALSKSDLFIEHLFESEVGSDVKNVMNVCRQLGCTFTEMESGTTMSTPISIRSMTDTTFSIGESGFALRVWSTVLSAFLDEYRIKGHKTILSRNHQGLIDSLRRIGFHVDSNKNGLPFTISRSQNMNTIINIDGSGGSQFISGLLMLSPFLKGPTEIRVSNPTSRPYLEMTMAVLQEFKGEIIKKTDSIFQIRGNQKLGVNKIALEGDWSNMAFHFVGAALSGRVSISGLYLNSTQADKIILEVLSRFGAKTEFDSNGEINVTCASKNPFQVDLTDAPDLFPVLSVLACGANGCSSLKGTHRLMNKESNRSQSICEMLDVFGVQYQLEEDTLFIFGRSSVRGGKVKIYNDHRMAMAAICAATISKNDIIIDNEECIQKSYSNYFLHMGEILKNDS